jgi:hypothetical protein
MAAGIGYGSARGISGAVNPFVRISLTFINFLLIPPASANPMDWLTVVALAIAFALIVVVLVIAGWIAGRKRPPNH